MTTTRETVLTRIQQAIPPANAATAQTGIAAIPRQYRQQGEIPQDQLLMLFEDRLRDYEAGVYRCSEPEIAETVAAVLATRGKNALVIPSGVPRSWLPRGVSVRIDELLDHAALKHAELDQMPGVLTGCSAAVALTGTVILVHTPENGRRVLTLIPDYHLCVVLAAQVSETLPEALYTLKNPTSAPITTISGPSATSDIEMTRVKGVHGPRVLDVILVV